MTRAGLSALGLPDTNAPIIDELAQASDPNPITRVLADAALLDLDRYATGQGLRYSRVGTTLMLAAPTEQRLTDAIDTIAAAAINTGARGNTPGLGDEHPAARARFRQSHRGRQQRRLTRAWGSSHRRARPRTHRRRNVAQGARHRQLWRV